MATMIFVNLPVKDLQRATAFYTGLGFEKNPQFSDENASCIVISDTIFAMLLVESFFSTFTTRRIADATSETEVILALSAGSKEAVDDLLGKAVAGGGQEACTPGRSRIPMGTCGRRSTWTRAPSRSRCRPGLLSARASLIEGPRTGAAGGEGPGPSRAWMG